jgi:hypothetical protein
MISVKSSRMLNGEESFPDLNYDNTREPMMAQVREVRLIDDLDGGPAAETIDFSLDGRDYQVDLSEDNALKLRDSIAEFVAAARRAARGPRAGGRNGNGGNVNKGAPTRRDREQTAAIRAWAQQNGRIVAERGRVPKAIVEEYEKAHGVSA